MNRKMRRAGQAGSRPTASAPLQPASKSALLDMLLDDGLQALRSGDDERAMEFAKQAIRVKETDASRSLFVECARRFTYFPGARDFRDVIVRAIRDNWSLPGESLPVTNELLKQNFVIGAAIRRANAAWPRLLPMHYLFEPGGLAETAKDPMLLALLGAGRVVSMDIERFLIALRAALLEQTVYGTAANNEIIRLCAAMGLLCFTNEYVFAVSPNEGDQAKKLRGQIEQAIAAGAAIQSMNIAMLACYMPLGDVPALANQSLPKNLAVLYDQQIATPAAERKMRDSIPRLTPVDDETSVKVRSQYESNPYPRWNSLPQPGRKTTFNDMLRQKFPFSKFREMPRLAKFDVLIAGCGTGRQPITFSYAFERARFLAVDLSLSSLCYAKKKSRELNVRNVDYAQADILELGRLSRTFDVVVSSGVLHHLADPAQGWRTLLSLLQPGGCMEVALYSELARRHIVTAQNWLAQHGYTASTESLRAGRQALADAARPDAALASILRTSDFYSLSECRDLLMPAQERRYTIPMIQQFLNDNDLEFLGFSADDQTLRQFRLWFSEAREADLNAWQDFETTKPDTFTGMYEFWVQKKTARS